MWVLLSARLRRWLLRSVVAPVLSAAATTLSDRIERRAGAATRASRTLRRVGALTDRRDQHPRVP